VRERPLGRRLDLLPQRRHILRLTPLALARLIQPGRQRVAIGDVCAIVPGNITDPASRC